MGSLMGVPTALNETLWPNSPYGHVMGFTFDQPYVEQGLTTPPKNLKKSDKYDKSHKYEI